MKQLKMVVEKHPDIYVAYPLGLKGVVIGQGDSYEAALEDVKSAIQFHLDTFGLEALEVDPPPHSGGIRGGDKSGRLMPKFPILWSAPGR